MEAILINLFFISSLMAQPLMPKVIYGIDDRMDVYESSDSLMRELSLSSASQIRNFSLIEEGDLFRLKAKTLAQTGICPSERFSSQPTGATCSGFLVAPDKLVTAAHCVSSKNECNSHFWAFDYSNHDFRKDEFTFTRDQIYRCTKILSHEKNDETGIDYTVVKLDRPVIGRAPLKIRREGLVSKDALLNVIGNPSGLPTKITVGAEVRRNDAENFIIINSDTYSKNSGSAVVDARTGIVEGILTNGDTDYEVTVQGCLKSVVRPQAGGLGERVTKAIQIRY